MSLALTPKVLRGYAPMCEFERDALERLIPHVSVQSFTKGTRIIERGTSDNLTVYLLEGSLEMIAADGAKKIVKSDSEMARNPIAKLQPRQYDVFAADSAKVIRIASDQLEKAQLCESLASYEVLDSANTQDLTIGRLCYQLYQDIQQDKLVLPTLPEIAVRIRKILEDEKASTVHIARAIQMDPAIAAKLIKAANSAL